ncbi:MAG TPA: cytochrome ubiquinol oxidase subunit I, partial [Acidimicrobiales bacterium]|nr:cytochrome ubiquinol oxidase subunit I [Acidimicrobiales bacterium]
MIAHYRGLRHGDRDALTLARRWSKVMAVLVAVGAVSGTLLSFEMGLLWPGLMGRFGGAIGIPFSIEGIFFLIEAVFVAIYLFGWSALPRWLHFWSLAPVVLSGILGAWSVVAANSWMNQPAGFTIKGGHVYRIDPFAVFFNNASWYEVPHMILAAYMVTGFFVASVYAVGMLRGRRDRYHRLGILIPFTVGAICSPLQIGIGDTAARAIAAQQPAKFAAMEYVVHTGRHVAEYLGGALIDGKVYGAIRVPDLDSLLVGFSPSTRVVGLDSVPAQYRPPFPTLIHISFDLMVLIGFLLLVWSAWLSWAWWRRRQLPRARRSDTAFLLGAVLCGPAAVLAMEAGWVVTEVGRQPWIVYKVELVSQAVTTSGGVVFTLVAVLVIYPALSVATVAALFAMARRWRHEGILDTGSVPYGPPAVEQLPADGSP